MAESEHCVDEVISEDREANRNKFVQILCKNDKKYNKTWFAYHGGIIACIWKKASRVKMSSSLQDKRSMSPLQDEQIQ